MTHNDFNSQLHPDWLKLVGHEFEKPYFKSLQHFLAVERDNHAVFPPREKVFAALNATLPHHVRVVLIGQDPYHGSGQANGLCFSVNRGVAIPPSLRNIYKELCADVAMKMPAHGDLNRWAEQGVLLLNNTLTVREKEANSHQNKGWELFTDAVIHQLNEHYTGLIFLLWGKAALKKAKHIHKNKQHILTAAHPSPLAAHNGFFGCKHFSRVNALLQANGSLPIDWQL